MKIKKILKPFVVALSIVVSVPFISVVKPVDANETNQLNDLKILNHSKENFIYTYEDYGDKFKVIESTNEDYTNVKSNIYKMDGNGEYKLSYASELNLDKQKGKAIYSKTDASTNKIFTDEIILNNDNGEIDLSKLKNDSRARANIGGGGGGWRFLGRTNSSSHIIIYTISAVTALIVGVAGVFGGWVSGAATTAIRDAAMDIVKEKIPYVYYHISLYRLYPSNSNLHTGERRITKVYKNSARTQLINTIDNTKY